MLTLCELINKAQHIFDLSLPKIPYGIEFENKVQTLKKFIVDTTWKINK